MHLGAAGIEPFQKSVEEKCAEKALPLRACPILERPSIEAGWRLRQLEHPLSRCSRVLSSAEQLSQSSQKYEPPPSSPVHFPVLPFNGASLPVAEMYL